MLGNQDRPRRRSPRVARFSSPALDYHDDHAPDDCEDSNDDSDSFQWSRHPRGYVQNVHHVLVSIPL